MKPAVQKAHNKWSVPCTFSRKLPRRAKSWPEIEIAIKRLAFSSQTPSIEPSYQTAPKRVKMSIPQKAQGFLKIFRVQNVALTVRRPKHPSLVWCTGIFLCETFSRLVPRLSNWGHYTAVLGPGRYYILNSGGFGDLDKYPALVLHYSACCCWFFPAY